MEIHVHSPHAANDENGIEGTIARSLERFSERLTRVEVFLQDVNGEKGGVDRQCTLEARPRGLDPLAASHQAATAREALSGAVSKLERVLDARFGRLDRHHRG